MSGNEDNLATGSSDPTPRELRAARRRAHEEQKKSAASGGKGGKGGKMGKGGGSQEPSADDRRRR